MKSITAKEYNEWVATGKAHQLIDVREQDEYDQVNMGGLLIPLGMIAAESDQVKTDVPVVVHCRSGKRSQMAIMLLERDHGLDNLYNLEGGILDWLETQR